MRKALRGTRMSSSKQLFKGEVESVNPEFIPPDNLYKGGV